MNLPSR
jgi:hypothetical protein